MTSLVPNRTSMTPPPNDDHPCQGCFLQEQRSGRICPAAREIHRLADLADAQRRADALHAAILADAQNIPAFAALVRRDAMTRNGALPASISLGLLAAPDPLYHDSREEIIHAVIPSRTS
jgi:hypothetical protein